MEADRPAALYFPGLDGLRFLAFMLVFIGHNGRVDNAFGNFIQYMGWIGVDLFFVLTGFLFYVMLHRERQETGRIHFGWFYLRRILRIMPLYLLYVFGSVAVGYQSGLPDVASRLSGYLTFTTNIRAALYGDAFWLPQAAHLWTIAFEEQVYLVLPLVIAAILATRRSWIAVLALFAAAGAGVWARYHFDPPLVSLGAYLLPPLRPETTLAGLICGMAWSSGVYRRLPSWVYGGVFLAVFAAMYWSFQTYGFMSMYYRGLPIYLVLAVLFSALLLYTLSPGSLLGWLMRRQPFPWLGKISYGLYIWHFAGIVFAAHWIMVPYGLPITYFVLFPLGFASTLAFAAVSYYAYERWFIQLKHRVQFVRNRPL